jgi:urease accessory protein
MTNNSALLRLITLMSPSFPVGGFSYSHGLEQAVADGMVRDFAGLENWLGSLIAHGSAWNDAVLFAESFRREGAELSDLIELGEALAGSKERYLEAHAQGAAFILAAKAGGYAMPEHLPAKASYAIAAGSIAAAQSIALVDGLAAFIHAFVSNQVQVAIRLSLFGQAEGVRMVALLEPLIIQTASRAALSSLDDLGGSTMMAEIAAMRHETLYSRIFRT